MGSPAREQIAKAHGCSERRRKQPQIMFWAPSHQSRQEFWGQGVPAGGWMVAEGWLVGTGSRGPLLVLSCPPGESHLDRTGPPGPQPQVFPARFAGVGRGWAGRFLTGATYM